MLRKTLARLSIAALIAASGPGPAIAEDCGCSDRTCSEWCWYSLWWSPNRGFYWGVECKSWKTY